MVLFGHIHAGIAGQWHIIGFEHGFGIGHVGQVIGVSLGALIVH